MTHFYGDSYRSMNCRLQHLPVASTGRGAPSGLLGSSNVLGGCHAVASIIEAARGTSAAASRARETHRARNHEGKTQRARPRGKASSGQGAAAAAARKRGRACSRQLVLGESRPRGNELKVSRPRGITTSCSGQGVLGLEPRTASRL